MPHRLLAVVTRLGRPQWRGQIEHVESGEKTYFQMPAALLEFIAEHLQWFGERKIGEGKASTEGEGVRDSAEGAE